MLGNIWSEEENANEPCTFPHLPPKFIHSVPQPICLYNGNSLANWFYDPVKANIFSTRFGERYDTQVKRERERHARIFLSHGKINVDRSDDCIFAIGCRREIPPADQQTFRAD